MKTRRYQVALAFLFIAALVTANVAAQRGGGAEPVLGRGAFQPTLWWGDEMFPKWPYPAGDAPYADLDGMKIKGYINEITAISRKSRDDGNQYWGRITGSRYDDMAEAWVEGKFKEFGLQNVRRQYF